MTLSRWIGAKLPPARRIAVALCPPGIGAGDPLTMRRGSTEHEIFSVALQAAAPPADPKPGCRKSCGLHTRIPDKHGMGERKPISPEEMGSRTAMSSGAIASLA